MTEILFYQLNGQTLEQVLPPLIARSLERGWRVAVQASSDERVEALDAHLWTWRDDAFLPHGTWREAEAAEQPVLLTVNGDNPNGGGGAVPGRWRRPAGGCLRLSAPRPAIRRGRSGGAGERAHALG